MPTALVQTKVQRFIGGAAFLSYGVTLSDDQAYSSNFLLTLTNPPAKNLVDLKTQVISEAAAKGVVLTAADIFIIGGFVQEHGGRAVLGFGGLAGALLRSLARWGNGLISAPVVDSISARIIVPSPALLRGFRVLRGAAPGGGNGNTYTVRKNGVDTAISCTISGAGLSCQDAGSISVAGGDVIEVKVSVAAGAPLDSETIADLALDF